MPILSSNNTTIYYEYQEPEQVNDKPVLVFIHGLSLDLRFWDHFRNYFLTKGYKVVVYDLRGHGKSGVPRSGYGIGRRIEDLKNVLEELKIRDNVVLIGHSLGGSEVVNFAVQNPAYIKGMILIDTWITGFKPTENSPMMFNANKVAQTKSVQAAIEGFRELGLFDLKVETKESSDLLKKMQKDHPGGLWLDDRSIRDPSFKALDKLDEIRKIPTLILVGEEDFEDFQRIADLLDETLSKSTKKVIQGVKHLGPLDKPGEIAAMMLGWLQTIQT